MAASGERRSNTAKGQLGDTYKLKKNYFYGKMIGDLQRRVWVLRSQSTLKKQKF